LLKWRLSREFFATSSQRGCGLQARFSRRVRSSSSNPPMRPALDLDQFAHVLPPPNRGDTFHDTTASAVILHSFSLIPTGTRITGRLIDAKAAGHFSGAAELSLELVSLRLPNCNTGQDVSGVTEPASNKAAGPGRKHSRKDGRRCSSRRGDRCRGRGWGRSRNRRTERRRTRSRIERPHTRSRDRGKARAATSVPHGSSTPGHHRSS